MYLTDEYVLVLLKPYTLMAYAFNKRHMMTTERVLERVLMNSPLDPDDLLVVDYKIKVNLHNSITNNSIT
jgi:hypothetical protein